MAAPFAVRVEIARALLKHGSAQPPVHLADQLDAATAEANAVHAWIGEIAPILAPDRQWRSRVDTDPSDTVRAVLVATMLACVPCPHLRRGGPQPSFARLPLRRVDCQKCLATIRRPPPDERDRCDVCGARGIVTFHTFAVRQGPAIITGDACGTCATVLGIVTEAAS